MPWWAIWNWLVAANERKDNAIIAIVTRSSRENRKPVPPGARNEYAITTEPAKIVSRKWSMKYPHFTRPSPRVRPNVPSKESVSHWPNTMIDIAQSQ